MATIEEYESRIEELKEQAIYRWEKAYESISGIVDSPAKSTAEICISAAYDLCYSIMTGITPEEATRIIGHAALERMKADEKAD